MATKKASADAPPLGAAEDDLPEDESLVRARKDAERQKRSLRAEVARRREALKRHEAERKLPGQILLIIFNSLGSAVVLSMLAALALSQLPSNSELAAPELSKLLLVMTFLIGFLLTLLFLMRRLPDNWWQLANEYAKVEKYQAPAQKWGGLLAEAEGDYKPLFDKTRVSSEIPPSLDVAAGDTPFSSTPEEPATDDAAPATEQTALFADAAGAEPQKNPDALTLALTEIERFTTAVVNAATAASKALDSAAKLGIQLYVAGACSALARKFLLSAKDAFALTIKAVMQAGSGRAFAESFVTNIEEYARRDAYRGAISAGQSAMEAQLRGENTVADGAKATIADWARPARKAAVPRVVTFVFTDIVDAGALGQRLGNLHAQRVIKAHDDAVQQALEKNMGTKVRHTGDGVIATFPDPARALAAAQSIQQRLAEHNKRLPHLSANVRIAINAGEAVEEAGTFFGAAIRMTAQLCDMGKAGQILAFDVIRSFCKSQTQTFQPFGEITVAELDRARAVFEVTWAKAGTRVEYRDIGQPAT